MVPTRDTPQTPRHKKIESKRMKNIFPANSNCKRAGTAILLAEKLKL